MTAPSRAGPSGLAALLAGLLSGGCIRSLPEDQLCLEVGSAIAGRTQECTGDTDLAEARYERFFEDYTCEEVPVEPLGEDTAALVAPQDVYACPLTLRNIPCALVEEYGDDLDAWLAVSDMCLYLTSPSGSRDSG